MGPSRTNSTSTNPAKKDEGSNHLVECTGPGIDGSGCVICTNIRVPMLIPKNFFSRPFLCGFCAVEELKKNQNSAAGDLSPVIEADSIEQYGRREKFRIFGVVAESGEDVFAKVVSVAEKAGVSITKNDVSTCHRLPSGGAGPKPLNAKFVRRETKHQLMKNKRTTNLKNTNIFVNDDLTPLRAKVTRELRKRDSVRSVITVNEKLILFLNNDEKLVFDNLYKLQKWDAELLNCAYKSLKKYSP